MLKISEIPNRSGERPTWRLEGRIIGPWVVELVRVCDVSLANVGTVALDLAEVSYADEQGVAALVCLARRGATLLNVTPFVREQLCHRGLGDARRASRSGRPAERCRRGARAAGGFRWGTR